MTCKLFNTSNGFFRRLFESNMEVYLNGNKKETKASELFDFLVEQNLNDINGIAIAVNEEVISKNRWSDLKLKSNDKILVITATQGG